MKTRRIHIIPSFHYDVAYLKSYDAYLPTCFANIDEALKILEREPDYRFLLEQVILLDEYWQRFPEKRDLLRRFAREGRLDVAPGMWVMPDMNLPDGESLFQQIRLGKQWLREHLDLDPVVCWIADCWGHHAQLPQILRACGYEYYVFWRCMRRDVLKNDFIWRGIDGTPIRAHWLARGYANLRFPTEAALVHALELNFAGCSPESIQRLLDTMDQYGPPDQAIICNGGDFAFPQAGAPQVVRQLNADGKLPPIAFATPTEALGAIDWDAVPQFDGEFNSALQGTFTSNIRIKQLDRQLRQQMRALEALAVVLDRPLSQADELWKPILKQQFHDIICGTITDAALVDCYREFGEAARALNTAQHALADAGSGEAAWFNPLPFARREIVQQGDAEAVIDLPPLGFAAAAQAVPLPADTPATLPLVFEAEGYTAHLDNRGFVTHLMTRHDGRDLVNRAAPARFGQLLLQIDNGDLWLNFESPLNGGSVEASLTQNHPDPYDRRRSGIDIVAGTVTGSVSSARIVHHSPERLVVEQTGTISYWRLKVPFTTRIHFWRAGGRIEYETAFIPTGRHFRVRVAFPSTIRDGRRLDEIPFGLQPREAGEHVAQAFCDYADAAGGLALINDGTPASNVSDDILMLTLFRSVAMEYKVESQQSYNENVPHAFRYAIYPHGPGTAAQVELIRQAHAFGMPPLAINAPAARHGASGWTADAANVMISAIRHSGDAVFVRVYEAIGQDTPARLAVPAGYTHFAPADGLQQPIDAYDVIPADGIALHLKPFEIRGLLCRRG